MGIHQIHRLNEIAMQRDVLVVVTRERVEAVQVVRVGDLIVAQRAQRTVDHVVESEIGPRGEVWRQNAVIASGHEDRRYAPQAAGGKHLAHAIRDAVGLRLLRAGQRRAGSGVLSRCERTQAERAVEVLVRGRATFFLRAAGCRVIDERDPGGRRDAVAHAKDLRLVRSRQRDGRPTRDAAVCRHAEGAQVVNHAEAPVGVRIGDRDRLRDARKRVAGLNEVLFRQDAVGIDGGLRRVRLLDERCPAHQIQRLQVGATRRTTGYAGYIEAGRTIRWGKAGAALEDVDQRDVVHKRLAVGEEWRAASLHDRKIPPEYRIDVRLTDRQTRDEPFLVLLDRTHRGATAVRHARGNYDCIELADLHSAPGEFFVQQIKSKFDRAEDVFTPILLWIELGVRVLEGEPVRRRGVESR